MLERSLGVLNDAVRFDKLFQTGSNRVLMYHSIGGGFVHSIPPSQLRRQLDRLRSRFEIVDLPAVVDDYSNNKKIAVTFDDGFLDFYNKGLPILEDLGIQATVFVIEKAFADSKFVHDPCRNYKYMSEEQVLELVRHDLVSIGNHTTSHPDLTDLNSDELEEEIAGTKNKLETRFGVDINRFAYPYNLFNRKVAEEVRKSHSFAVCGGPRTEVISPHTDPCLIPRLNGAINPTLLNWRVTDFSSNFGALYSSLRRNIINNRTNNH